jgi:hypothetical protein
MRRLTLLALLLAAPCYGLPPANHELTIQPSEIRNWSCDYGVSVTTLIAHSVILRAGSDATCVTAITGDTGKLCSPAGLITTPNVTGTTAAFTITPAGKSSGNQYQVTIVVEDSVGQRFACDGKVTVQTMKVAR